MIIHNILKRSLRSSKNIQFNQSFKFSNGNLWTSSENPLPESERGDYEPYFDFKYGFGQGGKLIMRLNKSNYNLLMHTLWEDYADVNVYRSNKSSIPFSQFSQPAYLIDEKGESNRDAIFSDETYDEQVLKNEFFKVYARVPEYYSYDIEVNGPITHESTPQVSSKIYGNVRAITPFSFKAKKLKTEICEINAENIEIDTFLESFRANITAQKNIQMKKCAISGFGTISQKNTGNISISSMYTNPERRPQNLFCNQNPNNSIDLRNTINGMVESSPHIKIDAKNGNISVGVSHGAAKIITEQGDIKIDTLSNQQIIAQTLKGNIKAHVYSIVKDSYIEADRIDLSVEQSYKQNIYLINGGQYYGEQKSDQPTLFVKGQISLDDIKISKSFQSRMPSFMMDK